MLDQGLIILAGVTGSGKSTTIASMLDYINEREPLHILTIEDPIEFVFTDKKAIINQREIGLDVMDWHKALKHAVREDPDVILVGEMRDRETFEAGIHAAETGPPGVRHHPRLVRPVDASAVSSTCSRPTCTTPSARRWPSTSRRSSARSCCPSIKPGKGRVPTNEIMIVNPIIRDLIIKERGQEARRRHPHRLPAKA